MDSSILMMNISIYFDWLRNAEAIEFVALNRFYAKKWNSNGEDDCNDDSFILYVIVQMIFIYRAIFCGIFVCASKIVDPRPPPPAVVW